MEALTAATGDACAIEAIIGSMDPDGEGVALLLDASVVAAEKRADARDEAGANFSAWASTHGSILDSITYSSIHDMPKWGCKVSIASNFNYNATHNDGSCAKVTIQVATDYVTGMHCEVHTPPPRI